MKFESQTVHAGDRNRTDGNWVPSTTPIYNSSTYIYESTEQLDHVFGLEEAGPSYGRFAPGAVRKAREGG